MAQLIQGQARSRLVYAGGTGPYNITQFYKNAMSTGLSDGACTDNGDGSISISFDAADTDTIGDLSYLVKDSLAAVFFYALDEVIPVSMGLLPNDGSGVLNLQQLNLSNGGAPTVVIEQTSGGFPALHVISDDDAVLFSASGRGLAIESTSTGISIESDHLAMGLNGVDGIDVSASDIAVFFHTTGTGEALKLQSTLGRGLSAIGAKAGVSIHNGAHPPALFPDAALFIGASIKALVVRSSGDDAVSIGGSVNGMSIAGTTGAPILYAGVEMSLAFANKLLDLADSISIGFGVRQALRVIGAAAGGLSFLTGASRRYTSLDQVKTVITATTDNNGQRTAVTLDPN